MNTLTLTDMYNDDITFTYFPEGYILIETDFWIYLPMAYNRFLSCIENEEELRIGTLTFSFEDSILYNKTKELHILDDRTGFDILLNNDNVAILERWLNEKL